MKPVNTRSKPVDFEISDENAVKDVRGGNRERFEVLVRRYNQRLFRVGISLKSHVAAEDAMQNSFHKAFLHLGQFQGSSSFSTWLTRIMINECLEAIRRNKSAEGFLAIRGREESSENYVDHPGPRNISLKEMKASLESHSRNS